MREISVLVLLAACGGGSGADPDGAAGDDDAGRDETRWTYSGRDWPISTTWLRSSWAAGESSKARITR